MAKKTIEEEINLFIDKWDLVQMNQFLKDLGPVFQLYDVDEENDWVKEAVGEDGFVTVRFIRTVYLISKIANNHAGRLCLMNVEFKNLWKRLEIIGYHE